MTLSQRKYTDPRNFSQRGKKPLGKASRKGRPDNNVQRQGPISGKSFHISRFLTLPDTHSSPFAKVFLKQIRNL